MPQYLLINYGRSVKYDNTIITAREASYSDDTDLQQLGELGQWYQDIRRMNPGDNVQLQDYLRRARSAENQVEGIDSECVESKLMEIIGTIHANGNLNGQNWAAVQLPQRLILQEREQGVTGLNDGVLRSGDEDEAVEQSEVEVAQQGEGTAVEQEHNEADAKEEIEEPGPAKQERSEAEAVQDLLRQLRENPG